MRLKAVSPAADCSYHAFQAFAPSVPSSLLTSSFRLRNSELDGPLSLVALSNPFSPKTLFKSRSFNKTSRGNAIRRSCSLNLDGAFRDDPSSFRVGGSANGSGGGATSRGEEGHRKKKLHCAISKKDSPFPGARGMDQDSFLDSRFDFLEPMMLGISPEFPDWPEKETATWATIEQKAKSFDIPLSLRMIKKKLQQEEGLMESESDSGYCSVKVAFASMVFIIVELQSCALRMRETLCNEDLEVITSKVQKDMHSSFVWLFKQVFSRTPALMLHVMLLLADFGVHSAVQNATIAEAMFMEAFMDPSMKLTAQQRQILHNQKINSSLSSMVTKNGNGGSVEEMTEAGNSPQNSEPPIIYPSDQFESVAEMNLWKSMVDDATKMREDVDSEFLDHDTMQHFVSPVSVEIEPDIYEDYLRTDLLYQMNLSKEPNNRLLLCNYAQFLHLWSRDYHRAEECFKRAVQIMPPDAEALTQYANFLWTVRKDYWAAEESYLQALSLDPQNAYYASRYANFLWSTGGEETCFPLNNSQNPNV